MNNFNLKIEGLTVQKIDTFINRCIDEKGYTLMILDEEIQRILSRQNVMHNIVHDNIYMAIRQQIQQLSNMGE